MQVKALLGGNILSVRFSGCREKRRVGVFNGEGPPVPIPNTEVKLTSAENTCLATDREDRSMPTQSLCHFDRGFSLLFTQFFFFCCLFYNCILYFT